ncbi:MAG: hypothetical protein AAGL98_08095, partial [Planctomycetota bacterium]
MPSDTAAPRSTSQARKATPTPDPADDVSAKERESGLRTIRKVVPYLWPADKPWVKQRVVLAMLALILSKVVSVYTPLLYRDAVDVLAGEGVSALALGAIGLTVAYGVARLMNVGFQQLRDAIYEQEDTIVEEMRSQMTVVDLSDEERQKWVEATGSVVQRFVD